MITRNEAKIKLEKEREEQDTIYPVYVDGNMHHLPKVIRTYKELITVKKCKKIVETVENHFDIKIKRIEINMCEWDYSNITVDDYVSCLCGDRGVPFKLNKNAYYDVKKNRLRIYQDGMPIYENDNGEITRDRDALADCLC